MLVMADIPMFGTSFYLTKRVKSRKETILRELPETMDVLVVSVEAETLPALDQWQRLKK